MANRLILIRKNDQTSQRGLVALFSLMVIMALGLIIILALVAAVSQSWLQLREKIKSTQSYYTAEAGIEDALYRIIKNKKYQATNYLETDQGQAEINISQEGNQKLIESEGNVAQRMRKIKVVLKTDSQTETINFHYGVQVGQGGMRLQNNAQVIGNVYSNGSIEGQSPDHSVITADAWVAGSLDSQPNQAWTVQNSDFAFGLDKEHLDTAQSFQVNTSTPIRQVELYLKKHGSLPDQTVRIVTDDSGQPSRTSLASGTLYSSQVGSEYSWVKVNLSPTPALEPNQNYWIVIDVSQDKNNYWIWGQDTNDGYALGTAKYTRQWNKKSDPWLELNSDLDFKIWLGGPETYLAKTRVGVDGHAHRISQAQIDQDAYYQILEKTKVGGQKYPNSADPPLKNLPITYNQIQEWEKAACCDTGYGCQSQCLQLGNYTPLPGSSLGPLKIQGNLTFPSNSLKNPVMITGPVWVTGQIVAENNVGINLDPEAETGYAVIADNPENQTLSGQIKFQNNVITQDNDKDNYLLFISTNDAGKDFDPGSPEIDNPAIWIYNNVNQDSPQSIIYAPNGLIRLENNAQFRQVSGQALYLDNNAQVVYQSGLENADFSTGPGASWQVVEWQEIE